MKKNACWVGPIHLFVLLVVGGALTGAAAIRNPYYTEPTWKLWYEDDTPYIDVTAIPEGNRLYPDDADTNSFPGLFLAYRTNDWPGRIYAGFWHDVWGNFDNYHTMIRSAWTGEYDNALSIRNPDRFIFKTSATYGPPYGGVGPYGINWSTQSTTGMGHDKTDSYADIYDLERNSYFMNCLRAAPAHTSYIDSSLFGSTDLYDAVVPAFFNSLGSSSSENMSLPKLAIAGGYLGRALKPELLRNGLFIPTMMYIWKAALPYAVPYDHELRHRVAYIAYGDGSFADYNGANISQVGTEAAHYNPTRHMANMVALAKQMHDTAPPIALLEKLEVLEGVDKSANKTAIRVHQESSQPVTLRVSVTNSFDLHDRPLSYRWKVLYGDKNTTVTPEGNGVYRIHSPGDDTLPQGRTVLMLTANNGVFDSSPAMVNIYRTAGEVNARVRPVGGMTDRTILPGETVEYVLDSFDPDGFPVSYAAWEGEGALDGNVFIWESPTNTSPGPYPVVIAASDGTSGNAYNGGRATIVVSETVAEIGAAPRYGKVPLEVQFSSAGSRDRQGGGLSYFWDFDDGTTSTAPDPLHTFTTPGFRRVTLTVSGASGSHTNETIIDVRHEMPLAIDNGWTETTIDPAVWTSTGVVAGTYGQMARLSVSGGAAGAPVGIMSVRTFTNFPVYIETEYVRPESDPGTGFYILGSVIGNVKGVPSWNRISSDLSIGRPSPTNASVIVSQFIGPILRFPGVRSFMRLYVEEDHRHPGRYRYSGLIEADLGTYFFCFDNQDALSNRVGYVSEEAVDVQNIYRFQVWTPDGAGSGPDLYVRDAAGITVREKLSSFTASNTGSLRYEDATHFGWPTEVGGTVTNTFVVQNIGDASLAVSGVTVSGTHAADFMVLTQPDTNIVAGSESTFLVAFTASGPGRRDANLLIASNDPDESPHYVRVRGWPAEAPMLQIEGNGANIARGDTSPSELDHTEFGHAALAEPRTHRYLLQNRGTETLAISNVVITGAHASDFTVTRAPRAELFSLESSLLEITFTPTANGRRNAQVTVSATDGAYSFALAGTGGDAITTYLSNPSPGALFVLAPEIPVAAYAVVGSATITNVAFYAGATWIGASSTGPDYFGFSWTDAPSGEHTLTAVAYADDGTSATTTPVNVTVANQYPQISILTPTNHAAFDHTNALFLTVGVVDDNPPHPDPLWVHYYVDGNWAGSSTSAPNYAITAGPLPMGLHTLDASAVDGYGITGTAVTVHVTSGVPEDFEVPFLETFEPSPDTMAGQLGPVHGQHGWVADPVSNAVVQTDEAFEGSQSGRISDGTLYHEFSSSSTSVWVELHMKMIPNDQFVVIPEFATAVFWVHSDGDLRAYDGTNVVVLSPATVVTGGWERFSVHCDYVSKRWMLVQGTNLIARNLAFYNSGAEVFRSLEVRDSSSGEGMYLDQVQVTENVLDLFATDTDGDGIPDVIDEDIDGDGIPNAWERAHGMNPYDKDDAGLDGDEDGFSNFEEYLANTDPEDPLSFFAIGGFTEKGLWGPIGLYLNFNSSTDRMYRVETHAEMNSTNEWQLQTSGFLINTNGNVYGVVSGPFSGVGSQIGVWVQRRTNTFFYRVSVGME